MRLIGWTGVRGLPQASMAHEKRMFAAHPRMQRRDVFGLRCICRCNLVLFYALNQTRAGVGSTHTLKPDGRVQKVCECVVHKKS